MSHGVIYVVTNQINGKRYVGQTTKQVNVRWKEHIMWGKGCRVLDYAIKKYGSDSFSIDVLGEYEDQKTLDQAEIDWIQQLETIAPNGYNLRRGGNGGKLHEETRRKISEALKGEKHPNFGKHHSDETRQKLSNQKMGEKNPQYGKQPSVEVRRKMSERMSGSKNPFFGKHHPDNVIGRIVEKNRGRKHSAEHKERIRAIMTGRQFTPRWRNRISNSVSKLSSEQIVVIRRMIADGISQREIAKIFDVHQGTISNINTGKFYKEIGR